MENDTEARALLRAYGDASAPAPARKDAAWAALSGTIGAPGGKSPAPSGSSWLVKAASAFAVLAALGGAAWVGLGDSGARPARPVSSDAPPTETAPPVVAHDIVARVTVPEPEGSPVPVAPSIEPWPRAPIVTPEPESEPVSVPPVVVTDAVLVPPVTGTLAEELAILRGAQRSLRDGDAASALEGLDDHLARFPDGALARDRDIARVGALCALDRDSEATTLAASLDASRTSPAIERALSRCVAGP